MCVYIDTYIYGCIYVCIYTYLYTNKNDFNLHIKHLCNRDIITPWEEKQTKTKQTRSPTSFVLIKTIQFKLVTQDYQVWPLTGIYFFQVCHIYFHFSLKHNSILFNTYSILLSHFTDEQRDAQLEVTCPRLLRQGGVQIDEPCDPQGCTRTTPTTPLCPGEGEGTRGCGEQVALPHWAGDLKTRDLGSICLIGFLFPPTQVLGTENSNYPKRSELGVHVS